MVAEISGGHDPEVFLEKGGGVEFAEDEEILEVEAEDDEEGYGADGEDAGTETLCEESDDGEYEDEIAEVEHASHAADNGEGDEESGDGAPGAVFEQVAEEYGGEGKERRAGHRVEEEVFPEYEGWACHEKGAEECGEFLVDAEAELEEEGGEVECETEREEDCLKEPGAFGSDFEDESCEKIHEGGLYVKIPNTFNEACAEQFGVEEVHDTDECASVEGDAECVVGGLDRDEEACEGEQ